MKILVTIAAALPVLVAQPGPLPKVLTQGGADWTWRDRLGQARTKADLDVILESHKTWIQSNHFSGARARLLHVDLSSAFLNGVDLSWSYLSGSILRDASLRAASMQGANLRGSDLGGADFRYADLAYAVYEPKVGPAPSSIAYAEGLDHLTWESDPAPVFALRKSFTEAGFRNASRRVTAAIHRHDQSSAEKLAFDFTCEWGENWLRPIEIIAGLWVVFAIIYWTGMHSAGRSGLYLVATGQRVVTSKGKERALRIGIPYSGPGCSEKQLQLDLFPSAATDRRTLPNGHKLRKELRLLNTALLFSAMSVLNLGFHEFNVGTWIRMMQARAFDIRARGWLRTMSGIQSLVGLALVALSLLSYFGQPFD